jgi:calcium permeable stress-gated cation channel
MKATFFITYVMVDGWAGVAGEILRLKPLVIFHLKNFFLVKTEKDREEAMDPGSIGFDSNEPQIQLYFLLGLVYAAVTPFLLPFILIFFGFAYIVYRHQVSKHILDAWYFNVIFLTIVSGHLVSHGAVLY